MARLRESVLANTNTNLHEVVYDDDVLARGISVLDGDAAGLTITDLVLGGGAKDSGRINNEKG